MSLFEPISDTRCRDLVARERPVETADNDAGCSAVHCRVHQGRADCLACRRPSNATPRAA